MKVPLGMILTVLGAISLFEGAQAKSKFCQDCCALQYKVHGCYKDQKSSRDLPNLVLYERYDVNWANWKVYMYDFICRCAYAAKKNNDSFFGIQFWGECWSGKTWTAPGKYGEATNCYGDDHLPCEQRKYCVGKQWSNYIYEIVDTTCDMKFEYKGCWKDNKFRALPNYLVTGRQNGPKLSMYGRTDWRNYDTYLPRFACECAKKAKAANETIFGLQFGSECWVGPGNYDMYGQKKAHCYDKCFNKCTGASDWCSGHRWSNAVYEIQ